MKNIRNLSGDGWSGYSGDGGNPRAARLHGTSNLALAPDGNIFSCEDRNHLIRKITRCTGAPVVGAISGVDSVCPLRSVTLSVAPVGGKWSSGDSAIATVNTSTGTVTGVAAGTTTITYIYATTCGRDTAVYTMRVRSAGCPGSLLDEEYSAGKINIFPNPATNVLTLRAGQLIENAEILDPLGRMLQRHNINSKNATFDISALSPGVYQLKLWIGNQATLQRFVKY